MNFREKSNIFHREWRKSAIKLVIWVTVSTDLIRYAHTITVQKRLISELAASVPSNVNTSYTFIEFVLITFNLCNKTHYGCMNVSLNWCSSLLLLIKPYIEYMECVFSSILLVLRNFMYVKKTETTQQAKVEDSYRIKKISKFYRSN